MEIMLYNICKCFINVKNIFLHQFNYFSMSKNRLKYSVKSRNLDSLRFVSWWVWLNREIPIWLKFWLQTTWTLINLIPEGILGISKIIDLAYYLGMPRLCIVQLNTIVYYFLTGSFWIWLHHNVHKLVPHFLQFVDAYLVHVQWNTDIFVNLKTGCFWILSPSSSYYVVKLPSLYFFAVR